MSASFISVTLCLSMFFPQLLKLEEGCPVDRLSAGHGVSCSLFYPSHEAIYHSLHSLFPLPGHVRFSSLEQGSEQPQSWQAPHSFPELGAAGQNDTRSPVTSVAASSPLWHLWQYRPQRDFLYCIKLAERRFSRCVAVPLASCDPVSQQILP